MKWKSYGKDQMAPAKQFLRDICASTLISRANGLYAQSPSEFLKYLKQIDLNVDMSDVMTTADFDKIDINSMVADGLGRGFPSRYPEINSCFQPLGMYEAGQMVMVSMPPGTGKTLFMMGEALNMAAQGARCHYLAMGDMKPRDFIIRMGAIFSGMGFSETIQSLAPVYNSLRQVIGDRIGITVVPSAKVSVEEYIEYIKEKTYDVLFIDYDSNFLSNAEDNMYSEYGKIYDKLTELTQDGKLVFVAAQPKISAWNNEVIQLDMVGESARKIHTVDILMTAGRAPSPNHLGVLKMCKNRRGEEGEEFPYIRLGNGRFKFLPKAVYDQLKGETMKKIYAESDIDSMCKQYNAQLGQINAGLAQAQAAQGGGRIKNPFC
jgi:archaellum biogenesis ATPase FlaH